MCQNFFDLLFISLSVEENMTQERKHLRKDVPQMLKQQIPNHQLHKLSHKTSPSLNNSHKMSPSLNNSHKAMHPLILNRNLFHHNSVMMTNFQIHMPFIYSFKIFSLLFSVPIRRSTNSIFFQFAFINTFNQLFTF